MHSSGFCFLCGCLLCICVDLDLVWVLLKTMLTAFHTHQETSRRIPCPFAGALWAVWRYFVVDFNERNNQQSVWVVAILSSDSYPNRQDCDGGLSNPTTLTYNMCLNKWEHFVVYKNGLLMFKCWSRVFSASTQSTNCDVCCDNASFLSSFIANVVSVWKMWQERMFVKEKQALDLISLQIYFHSNITCTSQLSILPWKTKKLY